MPPGTGSSLSLMVALVTVVTAACLEFNKKCLQHSHRKWKYWSQFPQPREDQVCFSQYSLWGIFFTQCCKMQNDGSWDDRDLGLGKMGTVTEVQSVLSLAWLSMWDQDTGTLGNGLSCCFCGSWYMVSPCYTQSKGYVPVSAISSTAWTCGFWLMEWKASKKLRLVALQLYWHSHDISWTTERPSVGQWHNLKWLEQD